MLEVCNLLDFCKLAIKILLAGVGHRFSAPAIGTSAPVGARAAARKQQQGGGCDHPFRRGRGFGTTRDKDLHQLFMRICMNFQLLMTNILDWNSEVGCDQCPTGTRTRPATRSCGYYPIFRVFPDMTGYFDLQIICELPGITRIYPKYPELPESEKDTRK